MSRKPWTISIMSTLPLNALSRVWGRFNDMTIPVWMRPAGYKLYSAIFGCNLSEMKDPDLKHYRNLAEFFVRELAPGTRPIDDSILVG